MMLSNQQTFEYDVAISFAGQDRPLAHQLFEILRSKGIRVFYDKNEQADLWGKNLRDHLPDVYSKRARYCLMIISKHYPLRDWTRVERTSAQARAMRQPEEYILPIRVDDTEIPGLDSTIAYVDARHMSPDEIAELVVQKLSLSTKSQPIGIQENKPSVHPSKFTIPPPQVRKTFTQLDKDQFIEATFEVIREYFREGLSQLEASLPDSKTSLKELDSQQFLARVYIHGDLICQSKIWVNTDYSNPGIYYAEGTRMDIRQVNSYNDYLVSEAAGDRLAIRLSIMWIGDGQPPENPATQEQAAAYLWRRLTSTLNNR
jgi:hypothetical protein